MIRVNLLPIEEERRRSAGRFQLMVFGAILALEIVGCMFLYVAKSGQVEAMHQKVDDLEQEVAQLEKDVEETKEREKRARKLQKKKDVLEEIERSAVGPGPMLERLQVVLSEPATPEQRRTQSKKDWNVDWNPNHLWLKTFQQADGEFNLEGRAFDHDDVGEFLHRLETTPHFSDVSFDYVRREGNGDESGKRNIVEFRITGKAWIRPDERAKTNGSDDADSKGS